MIDNKINTFPNVNTLYTFLALKTHPYKKSLNAVSESIIKTAVSRNGEIIAIKELIDLCPLEATKSTMQKIYAHDLKGGTFAQTVFMLKRMIEHPEKDDKRIDYLKLTSAIKLGVKTALAGLMLSGDALTGMIKAAKLSALQDSATI